MELNAEVFEIANGIIGNDEGNDTMTEDEKNDRINQIARIVLDYADGKTSDESAMRMLDYYM